MFYKCHCKFLFLVNVLFYPSWLLYGKYFSSFWLDCKQVIIILMLCCDVFLFLVKHGIPTNDDLAWISLQLRKWREVGRLLQIEEESLKNIDQRRRRITDKGYLMLQHWKERDDLAATYMVLHDALCHLLVDRRDLAEELRVYSDLPQFTTGNM